METRKLGNFGTWELWNFGTLELGNLRTLAMAMVQHCPKWSQNVLNGPKGKNWSQNVQYGLKLSSTVFIGTKWSKKITINLIGLPL